MAEGRAAADRALLRRLGLSCVLLRPSVPFLPPPTHSCFSLTTDSGTSSRSTTQPEFCGSNEIKAYEISHKLQNSMQILTINCSIFTVFLCLGLNNETQNAVTQLD